MKYVDADKIAVALGKMPTWPDFDVRGEIGNAPYCVCCCSTDECKCHTDTHKDNVPDRLLREAETIHEEMIKKEYHKMYKNPAKIPNCTGIIQRDRATIVTWDDNTKTTIIAEEDVKKNDYMMFEAFCIAFTKKMLGSTTKILNTIKENDTDTIEAARKKAIEEANKKAEEEAKAALEKEANDAFEAAVQQKMFEERVIKEAIRRISIQEARRMNNEDPAESLQVVDVLEVEVDEETCLKLREIMRNMMNAEEKTDET